MCCVHDYPTLHVVVVVSTCDYITFVIWEHMLMQMLVEMLSCWSSWERRGSLLKVLVTIFEYNVIIGYFESLFSFKRFCKKFI